MYNENDYIYQQQLEKAYKGVQRAEARLQGIQYGFGSLSEGEYYDPQSGMLIKQETKRVTPKVCEAMIAQYLSNYSVPLAQIPNYISAMGLKFKHIDEVTFNFNAYGRHLDVRHICDAGVTFGKYIEVPLITRDVIMINGTQAIREYRYEATYAKLHMFVCELCGTILYNYSE